MIESLESRRLLAVTMGDDGVLRVTGTVHSDRISVEHQLQKRVAVYVNGQREMLLRLAALREIAIDAGAGADRIFVDFLYGYTINQTLKGGGGNDNIISACYLAEMWGGNGRDYLSGAYIAHGGANADTLIGDQLDDTLYGDGGNDHLVGWTGGDQIWGGPGIDTVSYEDHADGPIDRVNVSLDGVANDGYFEHEQYVPPPGSLIIGGIGDTTHEYDNVKPDVENIIGTGFDDILSGSAGKNLLIGGAGADTLDGQGGTDSVTASDAADTLLSIEHH